MSDSKLAYSKAYSMGDEVRALQSSRLLNPDFTLREIISAAQKIPGLGDGSPVAWELITRDFVYRGSDDKIGSLSFTQIAALQETKAVNFDITLREILTISTQIPGMGGGNPVAWELISRDFVLRGKDASLDLAVSR
jgi:hypothetical protein